MRRTIFNYELKFWLKSPLIYLFLTSFFSLALIMMLGTAGFFDGPASAKNSPIRLLNSPYEINFIFQYFNKFLLFLIPVIVGTSLYRDYKSRSFHLIYSFPIPKKDYLLGKYWSSTIIVILISLSVVLALMLGEWILGTENAKIGSFKLGAYLASYFVFTLPNILFFSCLVFIIVGATRNIYAGFIAILLSFLFQIIVENVFANHFFLMAFFDPFGQNATLYETNLWTLEEKNTQFIPINGIILYNRVFWLSIAAFSYLLFYKKFELLHDSPFKSWFPAVFGTKKNTEKQVTQISVKKISDTHYDFSFLGKLKTMFKLSAIDYQYIVKSWTFVIFAIFGLLALVFTLLKITNTGEFTLLPATRIIISTPLFFYSLIIIFATFLYAGMLVHRAKNSRMNHLIDATAVANWALLGSKIIALLKMQTLLLFIMFLCGLSIQIYNGYFHFEIYQYAFHLLVITLPILAIWAVFSIFIHTLSGNLFVGLFLLILIWLGIDGFEQIGIHTQLLKFNTYTNLNYSDFNAYGQQLSGHFLLKAYWLFFAAILTILTYLFWQRGIAISFKERLNIAKNRLEKFEIIALLACFVAFSFFGTKIYKEEIKAANILNFEQSQGKIMANFKEKFKKYANLTQPKIDFIELDLDIFPEQNRFEAHAIYSLKNNTAKSIDTLVIKTGFDEITETIIEQKHELLAIDTAMQYAVYKLQTPILPNASASLQFKIRNKENCMFARNSAIIKNGTYLKHDILPRFGYLYDDNIKEPSDTTAKNNNYFYKDADLLNIKTNISTSARQIAIAPGALISEKEEKNGRKRFSYQTTKKVKLNFSFHSGVYQKNNTTYKGIEIDVFSHKNHSSNIEKMLQGVQAAIDYNTQYFSNYPFKNIRIVEYPHTEEGYAATLMANNVPTSEIQFVMNGESMKNKIDLPFYVMAHELTHQWFGNDAMPADALGAKMLTESITEYISLQIYKHTFGEMAAHRFLELQHSRYLRGRAKENKHEHPLYRVRSEQEYISYGKGAIAFNTLAHYVGEKKINDVLQTYLKTYGNRTDAYPTSLDFIQLLREKIDAKFHYLIYDFFETITYYDNQIDDVKFDNKGNGKQNIEVSFSINKYQNGEMLSDSALHDYVEIGFFDKENKLVKLEKIAVSEKQNLLKIETNEPINNVILDPNFLLIDKKRIKNK